MNSIVRFGLNHGVLKKHDLAPVYKVPVQTFVGGMMSAQDNYLFI